MHCLKCSDSNYIQALKALKRLHIADAQCGMAERRLLNDLMEYYQKLERPVANESEAVQLKERRLCSTHYLILSSE